MGGGLEFRVWGGNQGIEEKMETTIMGYIARLI